MADEVLSQSEIDQLLAAFASGDASVEEMKAEPEKKKVKIMTSSVRTSFPRIRYERWKCCMITLHVC